jgi:hypothetical protein
MAVHIPDPAETISPRLSITRYVLQSIAGANAPEEQYWRGRALPMGRAFLSQGSIE